MKKLIYTLIFILSQNSFANSDCELARQFPVVEVRSLSNGVEIPLPTQSCDVRSVALTGLMNLEVAKNYLKPYGLYPAVVLNSALGMLSTFNFNDSGIGAFHEMYFLVAATRTPSNHTASSILELFKSIRRNGQNPNSNFVFFYISVFSGTKTAQMMSQEIYHIPSTLSQIDILDKVDPIAYELKVNQETWIKANFLNGPWMFNPLGLNYAIMISGPSENGKNIYSPLYGAGSTMITTFRKDSHKFYIGHNPLGDQLRKFEFNPKLIEWAKGGQAAQLPPVESDF